MSDETEQTEQTEQTEKTEKQTQTPKPKPKKRRSRLNNIGWLVLALVVLNLLMLWASSKKEWGGQGEPVQIGTPLIAMSIGLFAAGFVPGLRLVALVLIIPVVARTFILRGVGLLNHWVNLPTKPAQEKKKEVAQV